MNGERIPTKGRLFLVAGGHGRGRSDTVLEDMLARLAIPLPRVAYIGAAHGDDLSFFTRMAGMLTAAGAGPVDLVPTAEGRRVAPASRRILETADLVFVSGGDVEEGMRALGKAGVDRLLEALFAAGRPFMGLSAGSIMLGRAWVRWRDPGDDATAEPFPCLGFAPFICDTHDEESGWEELKALIALSPAGTPGYGIPSGGGLVVEPDGATVAMGVQPFTLSKQDL